MSREAGKGDTRRPESEPGLYQKGYAGVTFKPLCKLHNKTLGERGCPVCWDNYINKKEEWGDNNNENSSD